MAPESVVNQTSRKINWSLFLQIAGIIFLGGIAWANFEKTADHDADMKAERTYNSVTYMSRELSVDRWEKNEKALSDIKKQLDENNRLMMQIILNQKRSSQ